MARFSLRPLLQRWSTRHSSSSTVTSDEDNTAVSTAPTSHASSTRSTHHVLHKASAPARLRDHFGAGNSVSKRELVGNIRASQPILESYHPDSRSSISDRSRKDSLPLVPIDTTSTRSSADHSTSRSRFSSRPRVAPDPSAASSPDWELHEEAVGLNPALVVEAPTPAASPEHDLPEPVPHLPPSENPLTLSPTVSNSPNRKERDLPVPDPRSTSASTSASVSLPLALRPTRLPRPDLDEAVRQSIVDSANVEAVKSLFRITSKGLPAESAPDYFEPPIVSMAHVLYRKIWVKRPGASPTLIQIKEDDLVDDVRDLILRKYANSLGKTFDAPDMILRIVARQEHAGPRTERLLGPEEDMCRTLDSFYSGGQTVDDALIIDVPQKRTPRPSPRTIAHHTYQAMDEFRPQESGTDYFPPMPAIIHPTMPQTVGHAIITGGDHPRSISVLNTGQLPPLPSPGGGRRHREHRPKYPRQHTSSPTILSHNNPTGTVTVTAPAAPAPHPPSYRQSTRPRMDSSASEAHHTNGVPAAPPLPSPPAPEAPPTGKNGSTPPTPSGINASPQQQRIGRPRRPRKPTPDKFGSKGRSPQHSTDAFGNPALPSISSILDGSVPPINVLIVEDNIINLRILEGLMKRLKVRWQTAMNGQIAVEKWRKGGYHLVLMDIQMPIMNGLQATKEIRRLERVNGIGVFSSTPGTPVENGHASGLGINGSDAAAAAPPPKPHNEEDDKLVSGEGHFKSPIIIVALTASSLQSDRHEALAAGCNDFLTKPVDFVWLERKVKEWGCMQALIDFDGWRKWKDYAAKEEAAKSEEQRERERAQEEKQRVKMEKMAVLQEKQRKKKEEEQKEKERKAQRASLEANAWSGSPVVATSTSAQLEGSEAVTTAAE